MIQKPESILRVEFINNLINLISTSNLPPYVIEPVLKDAIIDVQTLIQKQFEKENERYQMEVLSHNVDEKESKTEEHLDESHVKDTCEESDD